MANPRFNTQVTQPRGQVGRVKKAMGGMSETYDAETYDEKRWTS